MKILYDMSTGIVLEGSRQKRNQTQPPAQDINLLPVETLHEIDSVTCREQQFSPELAIEDLNAFLKEMS